MKKTALFLLALLLVYIVYILYSTGFFRPIENHFSGQLVARIPLAGVEDITVDEEAGVAIFISYDRAARREGKNIQGAIYSMNLTDSLFSPNLLSASFDRPLFPHGISLVRLDSSRHQLFVINHADEEAIEVFTLYHGDSLVHLKTLTDERIYSPNDIVAINADQFYFTNDTYFNNKLGKLAENYLGLGWCETVYFDGGRYRVVNNDLSYANGINYDAVRELVFIAAVRHSAIHVFQRKENGDLDFIEAIDCGTGVDNIELDVEGNLWVGCHPNLIIANEFIKGNQDRSPSEIIKIVYRGKGDYDIETVYLNDGTEMSASTVSANYQDLMLLGTVCDDHFVVLRREE